MALRGRKQMQFDDAAKAVFWSRVKVGSETECWLWVGPTQSLSSSYRRGIFNYGGAVMKAHQFAARIVHGERPEKLETLHSCDNALCVNPSHLSYGTHAQNVKDCTARGRNTLVAITAGKQQCIRGHDLAGVNLYTSPSGLRVCRECAKTRKRLFRKGITKRNAPSDWPHGKWK